MNTSFKILMKIGLILLIFLIVSFFVYWFEGYQESDKKGFERIQDSFFKSLFWYLFGLIGTVTGRLGNPFNFFLHIYGFDNEDFHRIEPGGNRKDPSLDN